MAIHNLKPRKPSNFKKKPKSNSLSLGKIVLYAFFVLLFIAFTVSIYQFRYGILQYIGYYSNSKTEKTNELAAIRVFEILQEHHIKVTNVEAYQTVLSPKEIEPTVEGVLFFSPSNVQSYMQKNFPNETTIAYCIGDTTATEAKKHFKNVKVAKLPTVESVIDLVNEDYK